MRYLEAFDPRRVFAFGQILSIFVFISYVIIENTWMLMAVQALLGVAWACLYVGALLLVLRAGEERGTASGIFQATLNLCTAVGPFLGGMISQYWGYHGVMIFAAVVGAAGMAVAVPQTKKTLPDTGREAAGMR
jgi:predicted MFS family arabinose efflux permease